MKSPFAHLSGVAVLFSSLSAVGAAGGPADAGRMDFRFFIAGGVCTAVSHGIATPVDVVKTRMQAQPEVYYDGIHDSTMYIVDTEGPRALYKGLEPTVVGYGIEGAMKFGVYEVMKPLMAKLIRGNIAVAYLVASIFASLVSSLILCPMESARIHIVTGEEYSDMGMMESFSKLVKDDGLWSIFGGMYAILAKQIPYTISKQISFDIVAKVLYSLIDAESISVLGSIDTTWIVSVTAAFIASAIACIFSQPGDMILTETYKGKPKKPVLTKRRKGSPFITAVFTAVFGPPKRKVAPGTSTEKPEKKTISSTVWDIYHHGGLHGFFTGTGARILHVGTIITIQLIIYDFVKQLLGLPATGSQ